MEGSNTLSLGSNTLFLDNTILSWQKYSILAAILSQSSNTEYWMTKFQMFFEKLRMVLEQF
jgi:hypothetical protein